MDFIANKIKNYWQPENLATFLFFFIAVWTAFVLFSGLPYGDLSGYDDAVYAHEARAMLQSGDVWTLTLNGNPDFDKPPLFIWLVALSFKLFGVTDFAAKIPAALLGFATVILVFFLAKEFYSAEEDFQESQNKSEWIPAISMLSMATTQYFLKYSTHAMTDVPFAFFFTLAIYFYVRSWKNNNFLFASGIAAGLSTLVRSPMGIIPIAIIVIHLLLTRQIKKLYSLQFLGCLVLTVATAGIWFLVEYYFFGETFLKRHFANVLAHSAAAASESGNNVRTNWQQFLWYFEYLFLIVKLYFPWFPLMFYGLFLTFKKFRNDNASSSAVEILLIVWVFAVLIPFSVAESKVLRYILPVFPAFAVLSARALCEILSLKRLVIFSRAAILILTLAGFVLAIFPNFQVRAEDMHAIAPVSDAATEPAEKVWLYTAGDLEWNYQNQLLWYGNRNTHLTKNLEEIESGGTRKIVVMDKGSYANFVKKPDLNLTKLGESKNFVCFQITY